MVRQRSQTRRALRRRTAAATLLVATAAAVAAVAVASGPVAASPKPSSSSPRFGEPWNVNTAEPASPGVGGGATAMYETFAPDGSISLRQGSPYQVPKPLPLPARLRDGGSSLVTPMHLNGDPKNRINLVFVGDGYTATEQSTFDASAETAWQALINYEPYKTYQNFFNSQRINVISPVSGISNDPDNGIVKATPLGMHFWCHNIDRLLCVDTKTASAYAALAPAPNHVIAIGHTDGYGGAGGTVTTLAGENPSSDAVIVHEMAHTIAGLGDEYQVPGTRADGGPTPPANNSDRVADLMIRDKWKWYRWIGKPSADGSTVGAYEGSDYYASGYYRPSLDSEMRTLGKPFNPPSIEALIESFYVSRNNDGSIDPIDTATPAPGGTGVADRNTALSVTLIPLVGQDYRVSWAVDGAAVPGSAGATSLNLAAAPLVKAKWNQVSISVTDANPAVQDEAFRAAHMTNTRLWWVWGG